MARYCWLAARMAVGVEKPHRELIRVIQHQPDLAQLLGLLMQAAVSDVLRVQHHAVDLAFVLVRGNAGELEVAFPNSGAHAQPLAVPGASLHERAPDTDPYRLERQVRADLIEGPVGGAIRLE
jgi:hypothetical protein